MTGRWEPAPLPAADPASPPPGPADLEAALDLLEALLDQADDGSAFWCAASPDGLHATVVISREDVRPELGPGGLVEYCTRCTCYREASA